MKNIVCYSCKSGNYTLWGSENGFNMVKCDDCGLLYVNPQPEDNEISLAIKTGMHSGDSVLNVTGSFNELKIKDYLQKLSKIYDKNIFGSSFDWLDIGCGFGEFILALQDFTDNAGNYRGIEPNSMKKEYAVRLGLKVDFLDIKDFRAGNFDFISILNVYSHLPDPGIFFADVNRILKKGGEILIQTGDADNLNRQDFPHTLYLPDHLSFASEGIIKKLLKNSGFETVSVTRFHNPGYPLFKTSVKFKKQVFEILRSIKYKDHKRRNYFINTDRDLWIRARKT